MTVDRQTTCAVHACSCSAEEAANNSLYLPLPLHPASCHTPPLQHHSPRGAVRATRDRGACLYLERREGRGWEGYEEGGREGSTASTTTVSVAGQQTTAIIDTAVGAISTYHANSRSCSVAAAASDVQAERGACGSSEQCNMLCDAMRGDAMHCTAMHCE